MLKSDENIGALHEDLRFIVAGDKFSIKVFFFGAAYLDSGCVRVPLLSVVARNLIPTYCLDLSLLRHKFS